MLFLLALSRVHTRCPCKYTATEKRLFFGYVYIYVCVRGEGEEKRIQNVAMLIYLSKSLYGIFIKYIYIYIFILELYFHE